MAKRRSEYSIEDLILITPDAYHLVSRFDYSEFQIIDRVYRHIKQLLAKYINEKTGDIDWADQNENSMEFFSFPQYVLYNRSHLKQLRDKLQHISITPVYFADSSGYLDRDSRPHVMFNVQLNVPRQNRFKMVKLGITKEMLMRMINHHPGYFYVPRHEFQLLGNYASCGLWCVLRRYWSHRESTIQSDDCFVADNCLMEDDEMVINMSPQELIHHMAVYGKYDNFHDFNHDLLEKASAAINGYHQQGMLPFGVSYSLIGKSYLPQAVRLIITRR